MQGLVLIAVFSTAQRWQLARRRQFVARKRYEPGAGATFWTPAVRSAGAQALYAAVYFSLQSFQNY